MCIQIGEWQTGGNMLSQKYKLTQNPLQSPFYEDFCNKFNNSNFKFSTICYETVSTCFYKDELK